MDSNWTVENLDILYADDEILVINKPSGMLVHRGWGDDAVVAVDLAREWAGGKVHPIHRLDRGTSGPLLFALNPVMARWLGTGFDERAIEKRYLGFVRGITPERGIIDRAIPRRKGGPRMPAVTEFQRLATFERYSLVETRPLTGRLHQVRRHLKHISHPLIGDSNYGKRAHTQMHRRRFNLARLALHSWFLAFEHPATHGWVSCVAPLPDDFRIPLERMGIPSEAWQWLYDAVTPSPSPGRGVAAERLPEGSPLRLFTPPPLPIPPELAPRYSAAAAEASAKAQARDAAKLAWLEATAATALA